MAAPVEAFVTLPSDSGNVGKEIRANSRIVPANGNTEYYHAYITMPRTLIKGIYYSTSALYSVNVTAQDGISTAVWWLQVPAASITSVRIRRLDVCITNDVATAITHATTPRFAFSRGTYTGSWSGSTQTVSKRKTTDGTNNATVQTASTSATVTVGNALWAALVPGCDASTTASGVCVYNSFLYQWWRPRGEDEYIVIAPGECLIAYQIDAGTSSDQRCLIVNLCWEEYDNQ
jgi:hypothetical protein